MLLLPSNQPEWRVLFPAAGGRPEVAIEFEPITIRAVRAARRAAGLAFEHDRDDVEEAGDELTRELIRRGIRAWRGIGDAAGQPVPVTPETVELFLADPRCYERADEVYVRPWLKRDAEGNVSSASLSGTGEAAMPEPDTAPMPATGEPTAGAAPIPTPAKAAATTSATRRARKRA